MNTRFYPPPDEEDTKSDVTTYISGSDIAISLVVSGTWDHFKATKGWGESSVPSAEVLKDEATGDSMYLKLGQLERRVEANVDRIDLHDERLALHEYRMGDLETAMAALQAHLTSVNIETEVRQLPIEEIKTIIQDHVEKHGDFWPDELAFEHNLSVWDVLDASEELAKEGYLEAKDKDAVPREE